MKTIKLILKGILMYTTILTTLFVGCGADSLMDNGYFFPLLGVVLALVYACYYTISEEDLDILSGSRLF